MACQAESTHQLEMLSSSPIWSASVSVAFVRRRLLDIARADGRPFNEVLQYYYAMERFPYRLGESLRGRKFSLKSARNGLA
jgi:hypothetical protein